jgi:hypothetical protein
MPQEIKDDWLKSESTYAVKCLPAVLQAWWSNFSLVPKNKFLVQQWFEIMHHSLNSFTKVALTQIKNAEAIPVKAERFLLPAAKATCSQQRCEVRPINQGLTCKIQRH